VIIGSASTPRIGQPTGAGDRKAGDPLISWDQLPRLPYDSEKHTYHHGYEYPPNNPAPGPSNSGPARSPFSNLFSYFRSSS
jgi:hypothetical protein